MNTIVRSKLIEVARKRGIIHYQDLSNQCRLGLNMHDNPSDRTEIGRILGEISEYEYTHKRPLLSALVLTRSGEEGDGFYKLCEQLGITGDWKRLKREGVYSAQEIQRCHEFWSKDEKFNQYA